jgi:outer membrane protein assembly factor BamB
LTALSFVVLTATAATAQTLARATASPSALFPLDHFWTLALDAPFAAPPVLDDRRVFVALQTGRLMAFEPGRNTEVWAAELAVSGPMVAAGGKVFAQASGAIHALDASSGAVAWRLPASGKLAAPLTHRSGWLVVAMDDGGLQAVRASDGAVVWARNLGSPLAAAPSIDGDLIAVALADTRIVLMDLATGKTRWERALKARGTALTLSGDLLFCGSDDGTFWSIKTRDGDVDWDWRLGSRLVGPPAVDAHRVYAIAVDNVVRGYMRGSGHERWRIAIPTRALDGPDIVDGLVVVTTGAVGSPGLTYVNATTGAAAGATPPLVKSDETVRVQYPVAFSSGNIPFALLATAGTSGNWQLHAYRQTFLPVITAPLTWGPRYEVRWRLEIRFGFVMWGEPRTLVPPVPLVPKVP